MSLWSDVKDIVINPWMTGILFGSVGLAAGLSTIYLNEIRPRRLELVEEDYDSNGKSDAYVVLDGGRKVPMYCVDVGEDKIYLDQREMEKRFPGKDYAAIEDRLNAWENIVSSN